MRHYRWKGMMMTYRLDKILRCRSE